MARLTRHFVYNLLGVTLPLALAVVAVPLLAQSAGLARLGFLTIAWALIGYLGFLDLGLSRVMARRIAAAADAAQLAEELRVMRRLVRLLAVGGAVIGAVLALATPDKWLASRYLPPDLAAEVRIAWVLIVATLPMLLVSNIWRGAMEGRQAFGEVNLYRLLFGAWMYGAPVVVAQWSPTLPALIGVIVVGRAVLTWLHWRWCARHLPHPPHDGTVTALPPVAAALKEGGWITLSNAVGPLMVVSDRFILGVVLPLAAVAAYAVPQEVALRLLVLPAALAITIFPAVASLAGAGAEASVLVRRAMRVAMAVTLPATFILALLATPVLTFWMGADFAADSASVLKILMIGIVVNAPAQIVFSSLQATGRARTTAVLHVSELLPYVLVLWLAVSAFGPVGAAIAWSLRVVVDAFILMMIARSDDRAAVDARFLLAALTSMAAVGLAGAASLLASPPLGAAGATALALLAVALMFNRDDRAVLFAALRRRALP